MTEDNANIIASTDPVLRNDKSALEGELSNCRFVKMVLMLSVVLYHSCVFWANDWFTVLKPLAIAKPLSIFAQWLNSFHVYGFTLVSGYLFAYQKWEIEQYSSFKPFIYKKAKRLLVPYAFISVIWAIPIGQLFYHYQAIDVIKRYLLVIGPSQLWFLVMLFWCFVGGWILSSVLQKKLITSLVLVCVSYAIGFAGSFFLPNYFCVWTAFQFFPFFVLGMKLRENVNVQKIRKLPIWTWFAMNILCFTLWMLLSSKETMILKALAASVEFLVHVCGAFMAFFTLQSIGGRIKKRKIWETLGKNQMTIYLLHQQIIYFLLSFFNGANPYLHALINFTASILISVVIGRFLLQFKITRFLIGEK